MLRALRFLVIAALLLLAAWGLASIPGEFTARSGPYTVETPIPVAIILLGVMAAAATLLLRLIGQARRAPGGYLSRRSARRQRQAELASQRGLVALAAGDAKRAAQEAQNARKLVGETPLVALLTAEAARLSGDSERAKAGFERLTRDKEMAFLGHQGLLRQHLAEGDQNAASAAALAAADAYPGSAWLQDQRFDLALKQGDYGSALRLAQRPREIAALSAAASETAATAAESLRHAKLAVKAAPDYPPAIAAHAAALQRAGRRRAARRLLLRAWRDSPHPLFAQLWLAPAGTAIARARAAAELAAQAPGHPESELLLAQTAAEAGLTGEAKRHATAARQAGLADARVWAVLAKADPANALAAAQAPMPRWSCTECLADCDKWQAICPNCGRAGTLVWTTTRSEILA